MCRCPIPSFALNAALEGRYAIEREAEPQAYTSEKHPHERWYIVMTPMRATVVILLLAHAITAPLVRAQETPQSEREAMYYRYLEFASYIRGGSIEPHGMRRPPLQEP